MLRRDYEKLRLANELGRSIGLEVNLELLLEQIIMKAFELIPADRGVILLLEDGVPQPKIAKTRDGKNEQIVLSKSILAEVVNNKASVLSSDATMDSRFSAAHSVIMQGIRSTMTVPLLHRDELLGIMHLDSMIATNAFTEKDLQIFGGIASQAAVAIHNSELARKIEQEAKTRAQFQRLLSPNLVDQVVQGKLQLEKGGALSEITLLFSDIRGFTSMSESREPQEIVRMLNEYFELMVDVIFKYEGTLDKFVGDEVIALFGAPVAMENAEFKAVQCALDMMRVLSEWNRTRAAEGQNEINIGIGINTGIGRHGRHRQLARAPVHRHRRRGEHRLAPLQRGAGRADHPLRGDLPQGAGRGGGGAAAAGAREGQGRRAARLQRRRPAQPRLPRRDDPPGLSPRRLAERACGRSSALLGLLLAVGAAAAGALIVLPAPSKSLALAAIVASERSAFIVAAALVALGIALVLRGVESPFLASVIALLAVSAIALGMVPLLQARQLAAARGVSLDFSRYLHAKLDTEGPGQPDRTVPFATVDGGCCRSTSTCPAAPGDPQPGGSGGARRLLAAGPARRGVARQPAPGRARVHRLRRRVSPRAAAELAERRRRREVRHRLGQAARLVARVERQSDQGRRCSGDRRARTWRSSPPTPRRRPICRRCVRGAPAAPPTPPSSRSSPSTGRPISRGPTPIRPTCTPPTARPSCARSWATRPSASPPATARCHRRSGSTAKAPRTLLAQGGAISSWRPIRWIGLAAALAAAGVPHETLVIPYAQHAFDFVPGSFSSQILEAALRDFLGAAH